MVEENTGTPAQTIERLKESPADRRAHPRIPSTQLGVTRVHIPNRATVSLVDLSAGGALLELPFQIQPASRFAVKLDTAVEQVEVPIQLLRCYVANLNGGVTYHAAGAFDNLLNVQALAQRASTAARRLLGSLERLQLGVRKAAAHSRHDAAFHEVLSGTITWLRRGESIDLVALKVKSHLTQTYPSLVVVPATASLFNQVSAVTAFGLTFTSPHALSMHDRRLLKAAAQLLALLEDTRQEMRDELDGNEPHAPEVIRTASDWLAAHASGDQRQLRRPRQSAPPVSPSDRDAAWKAIESLISKAAVL
jgi:PilZ domain-containing protein